MPEGGRVVSEVRSSAVERWDERYAGRDYIWDVEPNRFVAEHLAALAPGTAVDLAAGEGRNAVWLADCGWRVIAVDFSTVGLDKARRLAIDRGVADRVEAVEADALTYRPEQPVDLVVVAYLQIPAYQQRVALERAAAWLRPGGTILVVAHDRTNVEHGHGGPTDPDHCYDLEATVAALAGLDISTARIAERVVETEAGPRTALDTLVVASRQPI
jgi:ubiquinone/menaquinone biosynthesis C-methylase UbiE